MNEGLPRSSWEVHMSVEGCLSYLLTHTEGPTPLWAAALPRCWEGRDYLTGDSYQKASSKHGCIHFSLLLTVDVA